MMALSNQEEFDALVEWLLPQDSKSTISQKIEVRETEGSGRGIYASADVKSNTTIMTIDPSYLLNFTTIVPHIFSWGQRLNTLPEAYKRIKVPLAEKEDDITDLYKKFTLEDLGALSSFQIMSMFLVLESLRIKNSWWAPFLKMLPPIDDFLTSPFIWSVEGKYELLEKLPRSTQIHASKMSKKFESDIIMVQSLLEKHGFHSLNRESFILYWICINSRCLYMEIPQKKTVSDNFTMAPYVDFINHSSHDQCRLKIERGGFNVITTTPYNEGDELYLSYGPHSNEFLLCEYGFYLPENEWNDLDITEELIDLLSQEQKHFLKEIQYFGDYTLNKQNISFRTDIALAVLQEHDNLHANRRLSAMLNGITDGSFYKRRSQQILLKLLKDVKSKLEANQELEFENDPNLKVIGVLSRERIELIDHYLEK